MGEWFLLVLYWLASKKVGNEGGVGCEVAVQNEEVDGGEEWFCMPRNDGVGVDGWSFARGKFGDITR